MTKNKKIVRIPPKENLKEDIARLLPKDNKLMTTSRADYVDHKGSYVNNPPIRQTSKDPSLITGHHTNNLKVARIETRTKTYPRAMDWREEYAQFVKRAKWCNENIYKLFFVNPPVDYNFVKQYLRDLRKSTYMKDFSSNDYYTLVSQSLCPYDDTELYPQTGDYWTTYACYYNRLQEMEPFNRNLYPMKPFKDLTMEKFAAEMRKLFTKYNATTYFDDICVPALMKAKDGIMPAGHIDRYQNRKF